MVLGVFSGRFILCCFLLRKSRKGAEETELVSPVDPPARNTWPIVRFLAHSRSWTSSRRSVALGEKPKSATLRSKECERNRTDCRCCLALPRNQHRLLSQTFRFYSFNRGATDLELSPASNELRLEVQEQRVGENSYNRSHFGAGRACRLGCSVPFLPLFSVSSVVKTQPEMKPPLKTPRGQQLASAVKHWRRTGR